MDRHMRESLDRWLTTPPEEYEEEEEIEYDDIEEYPETFPIDDYE